MPHDWQAREADAAIAWWDCRAGGMVAYSAHDGGRVVFIEELTSTEQTRGHTLATGRRLLAVMLEHIEGS
eukprot:1637796-Prymnesium_polylepis.1